MFQGECLSTALFCALLHSVILHFKAMLATNPRTVSAKVQILAYVDDAVLVCDKDIFPLVWKAWVDAMRIFGLPVVQSKCATWIPGATEISPEVNNCATQSLEGLSLLGSAAQGHFSAFLVSSDDLPPCPAPSVPPTDPACLPLAQNATSVHFSSSSAVGFAPLAPHLLSPAIKPAYKRFLAAQELAAALQHMMNLVLTHRSLHPAWLILVKVVAVKLDYDCRISFPALLRPLAQAFDQFVSATTASILSLPNLPTHVCEQVKLPGNLSGMGVKRCTDTLLCAPVASVAQCMAPVLAWVSTHWSLPLASCKFDASFAQAALHILETEHSIFVSDRGGVTCISPERKLSFDSHLPFSIGKLQGRIASQLSTRHFTNLFLNTPHPRERTRLLSASGPGNGACFTDVAIDDNYWLLDLDFKLASWYRLGLRFAQAGRKCQHVTIAQAQEQLSQPSLDRPCCGADLFINPDHSVICKKGGGVSEYIVQLPKSLLSFVAKPGLMCG
jgi:hypothetical protein